MHRPRFHLRRVYSDVRPGQPELILLDDETRFGRNADTVDIVLTSAVYSNMISRDHATIRCVNGDYFIKDNSLNGTYINDKRVKEEVRLAESDIIKFGHMNGAAIKPGSHAPQANAEFAFMFERALPVISSYMGCDIDGRRKKTLICQGNGQGIIEGPSRPANNKIELPTPTVIPSTLPSVPPLHNPTNPSNIDPMYQQLFYQQLISQNLGSRIPFNIQHMYNNPYAPHNRVFPPHFIPQMPQVNPLLNAPTPTSSLTASCTPSSLASSSFVSQSESVRPQISGWNDSRKGTLGSPPMECDSSVPSPPKPATSSQTGIVHSSSSPKKDKDEEDTYSVPDTPPRAPLSMLSRRSVTNSPAPPSPKREEKPKEKERKIATVAPVVAPKKPIVAPPKAPKAGAVNKKNEVSRLLSDLTEGSFMAVARRNSSGAGSERRRMQDEGKKARRKEAKEHKMLKQLSDVSSDEESDGSEDYHTKTNGGGSKMKKKWTDESDASQESNSSQKKRRKRKSKKDANTNNGPRRVGRPPKRPPPKNANGKDLDLSFEDSVDLPCALPSCVKPGSSLVNWVQCDDCDSWYHNICILGSDDPLQTESFYCGCTDKKKKRKKKRDD